MRLTNTRPKLSQFANPKYFFREAKVTSGNETTITGNDIILLPNTRVYRGGETKIFSWGSHDHCEKGGQFHLFWRPSRSVRAPRPHFTGKYNDTVP